MLTRKCFSVVKTSRYLFCSTQNRFLCDKKPKYSSDDYKTKNNLQLGDIGSKYQPFKDEDSTVVIDAYEEKFKYVDFLHEEKETAEHDPFEGINLARGKTGVYEIEDLVAVLKRDNAENIFVASLPQEFKYVDYICIATGKSHRHMQALAQFVKRVYKKKRHSSDIVPSIEGENSKDWIALDLGNIALHVFSRDARVKYDLDLLWSVGPEFDDESNRTDPIVEILEKHSIYLKDLQPAT